MINSNLEIKITVLGSSSSGNSTVIHTDKEALMIDAGFSRKELLKRMDSAGIDPKIIKALLITHEHVDHVRGARILADQLKIPTYSSSMTASYLKEKNYLGEKKKIFSPGSSFEIGSFKILPFSVPHDAIQPVAFQIKIGNKKIGIATDLGHINNLAISRLKDCDALIIESNYDLNTLHNSGRTLHLKRRIMGKRGHLNNVDTIDAFEVLLTERTKYLILAHLSSECNDRELVECLAKDRLAKLKRSDILLEIARKQSYTQIKSLN